MVVGGKTLTQLLLIILIMAGMDITILGFGMEVLAMDIMVGHNLGVGIIGDGTVGDGTTIGHTEVITVMATTHLGIMGMVIIIGDGIMVITDIIIDMLTVILEEVPYYITIT